MSKRTACTWSMYQSQESLPLSGWKGSSVINLPSHEQLVSLTGYHVEDCMVLVSVVGRMNFSAVAAPGSDLVNGSPCCWAHP